MRVRHSNVCACRLDYTFLCYAWGLGRSLLADVNSPVAQVLFLELPPNGLKRHRSPEVGRRCPGGAAAQTNDARSNPLVIGRRA